MAKEGKILIVDDDMDYLAALKRALNRDFETFVASSSAETGKLDLNRFDLLMLDIRLNNEDVQNTEGIDLLKAVKTERPHLPVIMMTAYGDIDIAVETMKLGASDFIQKGRVHVREFKKIITKSLERAGLERKVAFLEQELNKYEPREIIGQDLEIDRIRKMIDIVAEDAHVSVLIRGETGTGKELVARGIHSRGIRSDAPFVAVSISSFGKNVVESELFGHQRGAFTGAVETKIGYIEKADGGVLFLDEIGDLDLDIQLKLLRFLENKSFSRMGSTQEIKVDLQLVAATNKDLEEAIINGEFRKDLFYRLNTVQIRLPTLSERAGDIPGLAVHFVDVFKSQGRTKVNGISDSALSLLQGYHWPGNVRELRSSIERAVIFASFHGHSVIMPEDLPLEVRAQTPDEKISLNMEIPAEGVDIDEVLSKVELRYIEQALELSGGRKTEAWKLLGYNDRFALRRRIQSILNRFPHLRDVFPEVKRNYPGEG